MGDAAVRIVAAGGDVDFMIHYLYKLKVFGQEVHITTTHISLVIVMAMIMVLALVVRHKIRKAQEIPSGLQNIAELIIEMLDKMVKGSMGAKGRRFANYIITIFIFIFLSNISGLMGLRPPTADYGVTLALGLITFVMIQYNNMKYNKFGAVTDLFKPIPLLFPINLIGEFATPLSLSLRLFGNILSGTVIMALIYGLMPLLFKLGLPPFLHIYFDLFSGAIQTYVFCMLTMVFISQKMPEDN